MIGLPLPEAAAATLKILGTPALACGTLVAGAAITFKLSAKDAAAILITSTLKLAALHLAALHLAALAIGRWLALSTVALQATVRKHRIPDRKVPTHTPTKTARNRRSAASHRCPGASWTHVPSASATSLPSSRTIPLVPWQHSGMTVWITLPIWRKP